MGGRKQKKKINLDWATKETFVSSNFSVSARNLRKSDLGAVIFGATHNTINECFSNQLFGLPEGHYSYIKNINQGLVLFLFNYSDRKLHGVFEAAGPGQLDIDRYAWATDGDDSAYTRYPAQVKICVRMLCHPLSEDQFQPIIAQNYYESKLFHFELDRDQTDKLVSLFTSSPVNSSISPKWKALYASLPAKTSKRQEYKASASTRIANLRQELPQNLDQTSKVSYASALGRTTTTVSSSQPAGKWSALFTSEYEDQRGKANTTRNEPPFNQEYEDKGDFVQADTWEGSHWDGIYTAEASECDQTWVSDLNLPQANTDADKGDVMQENTWEENQRFTSTNCEVEHDQTSHLSAQHFARSSHQPLDKIPDSNPSLPVETIESDIEEKHEKNIPLVPNTAVETSTDLQPLVAELMQEFEAMKGSQLKQIVKTSRLEQELDTSKKEIQQLKNRVSILESGSLSIVDPAKVDNPPSKFSENFTDSVLIVGGHDGSTWLPALDKYVPFQDIKIPLSPMRFIKRYASAATLNGELYHFSGDGSHTVESFNPTSNQWISRPPLYWKNINVAGASIKDRLFVVGGANGSHYSSEVEYLDTNIGRWLPARSMQSKRLAPAAAELNNVLYVSGGYDGVSYLSTVERFDPREEVWCEIPSMNARKGCHSMVVLNEKLYAIGGFSGDGYLASVEYLDTRMGDWVEAEPMNFSRGNFGTFMLGGKIYTVGGRKENNEVLDIVECYKEGRGWEVVANMKAIGKRSHFSAFVM